MGKTHNGTEGVENLFICRIMVGRILTENQEEKKKGNQYKFT